jgi:hypothetical protein
MLHGIPSASCPGAAERHVFRLHAANCKAVLGSSAPAGPRNRYCARRCRRWSLPGTDRPPETAAAAKLDKQTASAILLRRQSSAASAGFLWKLFQIDEVIHRPTPLRFARDYSFRELKANNAIPLGNSRSNPWVEPFESKLGIRWIYDKVAGTYYPADTWDGNKTCQSVGQGDGHEGYFAISPLSNLGGTGNVLLIAGTGGSAINAGADFLAKKQAFASLRNANSFPPFEAPIKVKGRSALPGDARIVVCRPPRGEH